MCEGVNDPSEGRGRWGLNLLGKALMEARRILRDSEEAEAVAREGDADGGDGNVELHAD